MTALATTMQPAHIRCSGGDILVGRIWLKPGQAQQLLAIWRDERCSAFQADDKPAWDRAAALHGAMLRAILAADAWRRAAQGTAA